MAVRGAALLALVAFGALRWMHMVDPAPTDRGWWTLGLCAALALGLGAAGRARGRGKRTLTAAVMTVLGLGLGLLAAGVAPRMLAPGHWGALAGGLGRGLAALPGVHVPYGGLDDWLRVALTAGAPVAAVVATALALWPRSGGRAGWPLPAVGLLVALYAVPAVAVVQGHQFAGGAALGIGVLAFLRAESVRLGDSRTAVLVAAGAAILAVLAAPLLDNDRPWWDYQSWALSRAASRTTAFRWNHDYNGLHWPRDGRELLRVRARRGAYWKADALDRFDGAHWVEAAVTPFQAAASDVPPGAEARRWLQVIRVTVRNLRSRTFIGAGTTLAVRSPGRTPLPASVPGIYAPYEHELVRGDAYDATVYTPEAPSAVLARAGTAYADWLRAYTTFEVRGSGQRGHGGFIVDAPPFGSSAPATRPKPGDPRGALPASDALAHSDLARTWALSQRLRAHARTPYDYIRAVQSQLAIGYDYSELPPVSAGTLEGFLFDAKVGYCQQFSGAMALLLRMGGVPARVATGFTSGVLDRASGEWVVRDYDAHSWVEAWFPGIGWFPFDPTPTAAPPRRELDAIRLPGLPASQGVSAGDRPVGRGRAGAATVLPWSEVGGGLALLAALGAAGAWARARRGRKAWTPVGDLERALRRARRAPAPGDTLQALEAALERTPSAAAYVRALREFRFGSSPELPTARQRRGLRRELGRGQGPFGHLRAWWALPPRIRRSV